MLVIAGQIGNRGLLAKSVIEIEREERREETRGKAWQLLALAHWHK